jgi:predicted RNase H-like nuclease (RuvC/YqgF family)
MTELLLIIIPSAMSSAITWLITRRKNTAEAESSELDNVEKAIKIWRELSTDLETRLRNDIQRLREENSNLRIEIEVINRDNEAMREQISDHQKQLKASRCENKKLLEELKKYNNNFTLPKEG